MSTSLRVLLVFVGITVSCFLGIGGWYMVSLKPDSAQQEAEINRNMPAIERALRDQDDDTLHQLADRFKYAVVITDSSDDPISSNLGMESRQRISKGKTALQNHSVEQLVRIPEGLGTVHYEKKAEGWDPVLLFPLCFSLLLGMIGGFREYMVSSDMDTKDRALASMSDYEDEHSEQAQSRAEELRQQVKRVGAQLTQAQQRAETAEQKYLQASELLRKNQLKVQEGELGLAPEPHISDSQQADHEAAIRLKEREVGRLQERILVLEQMEEHYQKKQADSTQAVKDAQKAQKEAEAELSKLEAENIKLHQQEQEKIQLLNRAQERQSQMEEKLNESFGWQKELEYLREHQRELKEKEEEWLAEKKKVMTLFNEKDKELLYARTTLEENKKKLHEVSTAHKKLTDLIRNMPKDMSEVQEKIARLIDEKDRFEQSNAELSIEITDKISEINRLRRELGTRNDDLEESEKLSAILNTENSELKRELQRLGETLADKIEDLARLEADASESQKVLQEAIMERDQAINRAQIMEEKIETLTQQKNVLLFENQSLHEKLEAINVAQYEFQLNQLRTSLQMMTNEQQKKNVQIDGLKDKLKQGGDIYDRLKRSNDKKERQISHLKDRLGRYRGYVQGMSDENKMYQHVLEAQEYLLFETQVEPMPEQETESINS